MNYKKLYTKGIFFLVVSSILILSCSSSRDATKASKNIDDVNMEGIKEKTSNQNEKNQDPKLDLMSRRILISHFKSNIKKMDCKEKGRVIVSFTVAKNAEVVNEKVIRSLSPNCDKAILSAFKYLIFENPGVVDGKPVNVEFAWPFRIQ